MYERVFPVQNLPVCIWRMIGIAGRLLSDPCIFFGLWEYIEDAGSPFVSSMGVLMIVCNVSRPWSRASKADDSRSRRHSVDDSIS